VGECELELERSEKVDLGLYTESNRLKYTKRKRGSGGVAPERWGEASKFPVKSEKTESKMLGQIRGGVNQKATLIGGSNAVLDSGAGKPGEG